jgi:hypothetical protein
MENQTQPNNLSEVYKVAKFQKYLLILILISFIIISSSENLILNLPSSILGMYFVYEIGMGLKLKNVWLWVIGTFVPLLGLIVMLIINNKATKFIKLNGFRVGLLGADVEEIKAKMLETGS